MIHCACRPAALFVAVSIVLASCSSPPEGTDYALLTPNYGGGVVTVLLPADRVDGGVASTSWYVGSPDTFGPNGLMLGPDGRLYVGDAGESVLYVIDPADATADGDVTPVATITSDDLDSPYQGSFDRRGRLWIVNYSAQSIVRFDDLLDVEASDTPIDVAADLVLTSASDDFVDLYDVVIDADDDVWVADYGCNCVFRFDASDVFDEVGDLDVAAALVLSSTESVDAPTGDSINFPFSIWITDDGTLYVANEGDQVSRYDDATNLVGQVAPKADAYLTVGVDGPEATMVLVDDDGALWIAYDRGELVKIDDPTSYTGVANVREDASLVLTWAEEGGPAPGDFLDGGRQLFVPIPR